MHEILKAINTEMKALGIEYYYLYNNAPEIHYPYVTGEYSESGYSYEDNSNTGDMLLEVWNRDRQLELFYVCNKIKNHFRDLLVNDGKVTAHIAFNSAMPVRTNDASLYKIEIHLDVNYWEGE